MYVANLVCSFTSTGIRGEVNVIVKVDYFVDSNKFKQSSCGVQFFYSKCGSLVTYDPTPNTSFITFFSKFLRKKKKMIGG